MGKICPKCDAINKNSADFCENCGELFPDNFEGSASVTSSIIMKALPFLVILGVLGFIFLGAFDFEETTSLTESFSSDGLTFNYPSDWDIVKSSGEIDNSGTLVQDLGILTSDDITLTVSGADLSEGWSVAEAKESTKNNIKNVTSAQILSDTQRTVNGVTVYEMIGLVEDQNSKQKNKFLYVVTGEDKKVVYYMQFIAEASAFDNNQELMEEIVNTIKIE
jgi:hypothetical protein